MRTEMVTAADGKQLFLRTWDAEIEKCCVLLAHGMTEHSGRYDDFGCFLAEHGISLYCHDQRGHGHTALWDHTLGHLRKGLDWNLMISDLLTIKNVIRKEHHIAESQAQQLPIFLMGHSMGSFLVRCAVQANPDAFDGLILSGTGSDRGIAGSAGLELAKAGCLIDEAAVAKGIQKLTFGSFNYTVQNPRTEFDWLTRDPEMLQQYMEDDLCGFLCTNGFYHELFSGMQQAHDLNRMRLMRKHMPVYFFSGDKDPVGSLGKGVEETCAKFLRVGMHDVTCKLYPDGRHEMLNELDQQQVYADLLHWLEGHISNRESSVIEDMEAEEML